MNFTGVGAMGAVDQPMAVSSLGVNIPKTPPKALKKKDRKTVVREAALRVVNRLLDDEQTDTQAAGVRNGIGRHA